MKFNKEKKTKRRFDVNSNRTNQREMTTKINTQPTRITYIIKSERTEMCPFGQYQCHAKYTAAAAAATVSGIDARASLTY